MASRRSVTGSSRSIRTAASLVQGRTYVRIGKAMTYTLTMEPERPASQADGSGHKGRTGGESFPMNALQHLSSQDLCMLLECDPHDVLGKILELNHSPRYHNTLNAVELANVVGELRKAVAHGPVGPTSPDERTPQHG